MNRREFANSAGACALCIVSGSFSGCQSSPKAIEVAPNQRGEVVISRARFEAQGSPNMLVQIPGSPFPISLLQLSGGSFAACLMSCPHQRATVVYTKEAYICPVHGARFSHGGDLQRGPATRGLLTYPVRVSDIEIRIAVS